MSTLQGIAVVVLIVVALGVMAVVSTENARRRRAKLRRRFGSASDVIRLPENKVKGERELNARRPGVPLSRRSFRTLGGGRPLR